MQKSGQQKQRRSTVREGVVRSAHGSKHGKVVRLMRRFGFRPRQVVRVKAGVFRVKDWDGADYCLKRLRCTGEELAWMDAVLSYMQQKGIPVAWSVAGKPLVSSRDEIQPREDAKRQRSSAEHRLAKQTTATEKRYIVSPWIHGRAPDPSSHSDMEGCGRALARFHETGRRSDIVVPTTRDFLGRWPRLFQQKRALLQRAIQRANTHPRPSDADLCLRKHGPQLLARADTAVSLLQACGYARLCQKARQDGWLCHGDSGPKNFVVAGGQWVLIDFETLRRDLRAYDLFRLIRLACKHRNWPMDTAQAILSGYQAVSPLQPSEFDLIRVWLLFPHKVTRILARNQEAVERRKKLGVQLARTIAEEHRYLARFLREFEQAFPGRISIRDVWTGEGGSRWAFGR